LNRLPGRPRGILANSCARTPRKAGNARQTHSRRLAGRSPPVTKDGKQPARRCASAHSHFRCNPDASKKVAAPFRSTKVQPGDRSERSKNEALSAFVPGEKPRSRRLRARQYTLHLTGRPPVSRTIRRCQSRREQPQCQALKCTFRAKKTPRFGRDVTAGPCRENGITPRVSPTTWPYPSHQFAARPLPPL